MLNLPIVPRSLAWPGRLVGLAFTTVLLAGCASMMTPTKPEDAVRQRSQQRWELMRADKFDQAYQLVAPSYRSLKDMKTWRSNYGAAELWTGAEVTKVSCESETKCTSVVMVSIKNLTPIRTGATLRTAIEETWVLENGSWYFLQPL